MDSRFKTPLEDLVSSLSTSLSLAKSVGMDLHFISELDHLRATAIHNLNETKENNKPCN